MIKKMLAFIDDTNLCANGQGCGEMMNAVRQECPTLHETVGGKMQSSKPGFFAWQ